MESKTPQCVTDLLTRDEIRELTRASNARGVLSLLTTWGLIAAGFGMVAVFPHVTTVVGAVILLGGRQLALAILMHECSHRSLFASRRANDVLGQWLCGAPVWTHLLRYRKHHIAHHNHTGTDKDPDIGLVDPFPVTRLSLVRKFGRDLFGLTGLKRIVAQLLMDFGVITYTASTKTERIPQKGRRVLDVLGSGARNTGPFLLTNAILLLVLTWVGQPMLYLLWVAAYMTTFSFFLRIRSLAEHACTERSADIFRNTRTTHAGPLARLTVAPHDVNFHLEHHLLMTVPHYHLRAMHRILRERGALQNAQLESGYRPVLARVSAQSSSVV